MDITGLLLAAGRGRRMGGNKQFYRVPTPAGDKPLVAAAFDTIAPVCDAMFVVVGHRADEVAGVLAPRHFELIAADADAAMIDSIKVGLKAVFDSRQTATQAGDSQVVLLQLGDHPSLSSGALKQILSIAAEHPGKAVIPTYQGSGGHPVAIPVTIARQILDSPCPGGLRLFWKSHAELCMRTPVDDPFVVRDIDGA